MLDKIKTFILIFLWGCSIGLLLCYLTFAYINFTFEFKIIALASALLIFIFNLIGLKFYSDSLLWARVFLRTFLVHFFLISLAGSIWIYITENIDTGFYERIILLLAIPLIMFGAISIVLLRLIWNDNRISRNLEENIKAVKFILGFKNK